VKLVIYINEVSSQTQSVLYWYSIYEPLQTTKCFARTKRNMRHLKYDTVSINW